MCRPAACFTCCQKCKALVRETAEGLRVVPWAGTLNALWAAALWTAAGQNLKETLATALPTEATLLLLLFPASPQELQGTAAFLTEHRAAWWPGDAVSHNPATAANPVSNTHPRELQWAPLHA